MTVIGDKSPHLPLTAYATGVASKNSRGSSARGKGKKERHVIFWEIAQDVLRVYLPARKRALEIKQCTSNSLFFGLTAGGAEIQRLTVRQISRIVKQVARANGVPVRHPHSLRHSFATHMLDDAGIVAVSKLLGHSKLSTTERYTHLSPATMMKAYHGAFPSEDSANRKQRKGTL